MSRDFSSRRWIAVIAGLALPAGWWIFSGFSPKPSAASPDACAPAQVVLASEVEGKSDIEPSAAPSGETHGPEQEKPQLAADNGPPAHPADPLLAGSTLLSDQWSVADAAGNRRRTAIYHTELFKYPLLRVEEKWSGKTGGMDSRVVMVADHLLVAPRSGTDAAGFGHRISAEGFTIEEALGASSMRVSFDARADDPEELPRRITTLAELAEYAEPDFLVWPCAEPNDPAFTDNILWALRNPGGVSGYTAGADIGAVAAWAVRNDAGNVVVAVTDTGIRYDHEDLAPNM